MYIIVISYICYMDCYKCLIYFLQSGMKQLAKCYISKPKSIVYLIPMSIRQCRWIPLVRRSQNVLHFSITQKNEYYGCSRDNPLHCICCQINKTVIYHLRERRAHWWLIDLVPLVYIEHRSSYIICLLSHQNYLCLLGDSGINNEVTIL